MISANYKKEKTRCKVTLHLSSGDVVLHFADFEDLGHKDPTNRYSFIYFEDSSEVLPVDYEIWHEHNIWHGHTSKANPCNMTVHILGTDGFPVSCLHYLHVLPERSFMAPMDDNRDRHKLKAVDFRYLRRQSMDTEALS